MSEPDVKPADILSKLDTTADASESNLSDWFGELEKGSSKTLEKEENEGILGMRTRWSNWVLFLIVLIVLFDMVLVILLGSGIWQFTNPSIIITVITDNFLKIVGLGFLITREIFKKIYH